ncbi:SPOSA6832_02678 [Sporobolomyces salmonicolor]|uniref:SPOSA6832_02678-mRNA-1:cds n=1 Tax=Sporidiobolus salmonicolor TaxID=5005 RepID=A0A0D6ELX9_SPOSA|nr:SPOSA6832_02678 [Sporobolomyces salmonicolor]
MFSLTWSARSRICLRTHSLDHSPRLLHRGASSSQAYTQDHRHLLWTPDYRPSVWVERREERSRVGDWDEGARVDREGQGGHGQRHNRHSPDAPRPRPFPSATIRAARFDTGLPCTGHGPLHRCFSAILTGQHRSHHFPRCVFETISGPRTISRLRLPLPAGHPEFNSTIVNTLIDVREAKGAITKATAEESREYAGQRDDGVKIGRRLLGMLGV